MAEERDGPVEQASATDQPSHSEVSNPERTVGTDHPTAGGDNDASAGDPVAPRADAEPAVDDDRAGQPDSATSSGERFNDKVAEVINIFHDRVRVGVAGISGATGMEGSGRRRTSGRLDPAEIDTDRRHFISPKGYDDALNALATDRVVVLYGVPGLGKRAGAVNLLRELTSGPLVVLSPVTTLRELAHRHYERDYGYLVFDRKEKAGTSEVDFVWRTVRDQVQEAGAHLVVTANQCGSALVEAVRHVEWHRPDLRAVLRAHLAERADDEIVETIAAQLTDEHSMGDIVALAQRVAGGEDHWDALTEFDEASARKVRQWFEQKREFREILEVTALAIIEGENNRSFETMLTGLEAAMVPHLPAAPVAEQPEGKPDEVLPARRRGRQNPDGLIGAERVNVGASTRSLLVFRRPEYRRHVLAELHERWESPFWDGLREWIESLISVRPSTQCAEGLALLAAIDFDEVEGSYLEPWSRGEIGLTGQTTAVYVLWSMCYADVTAPIALQTARYWVDHGTATQRWTAAMAYSGELGLSDPTQAIRQLWRILLHRSSDVDVPAQAIAMLFATLTAETDDAGKVLTTIEQRLTRQRQSVKDEQDRDRAYHVLRKVLTVRDPRRRTMSVFLYIEKHPDRIPHVARLWARAICHRGHRYAVLDALWSGLARLRRTSEEPLKRARQLAEALAAALPPPELAAFHHDFGVVDDRRQRGQRSSSGSFALVLLNVIERHYRKAGPEGQA